MRKTILFLMSCLLMSITNANAQKEHNFSYSINPNGLHFERTASKEAKVIENSGDDFVIGQFSLIATPDPNDGYFLAIEVDELSTDGRVGKLMKMDKGTVELTFRNGEVLTCTTFTINDFVYTPMFPARACLRIPIAISDSRLLQLLTTYDITKISFNDISFNLTKALPGEAVHTANLISRMLKDLKSRLGR